MILTWICWIWIADPVAELGRRGLGARAGDDRLDGALEVVALEAGVAGVDVGADDRAVTLFELVVDQPHDPLEEVDTLLVGRARRRACAPSSASLDRCVAARADVVGEHVAQLSAAAVETGHHRPDRACP